jgi:hypothetical protein
MEAVRTLKTNLKLEGKPCGWCQIPLKLGDDAAVCTSCEKEHHRTCWDGKAGCATAGCVGAPLRQLDVAADAGRAASMARAATAATALPPGMMNCPRCGLSVSIGTQLCPACRAITTPDGLYHGPKTNAPGAVKSLVVGIIGLFLCGIVLGPIAISASNKARQAIAADAARGGAGLAIAGLVLGILDIVGFAIAIMYRASVMH